MNWRRFTECYVGCWASKNDEDLYMKASCMDDLVWLKRASMIFKTKMRLSQLSSVPLLVCLFCVPSYPVHLNHWLLYWKHISTRYILNISPKFLVWHFHTLKPWNLNLVKHHLNYTPDSHIIVARVYVSWPSLIRHPSRTRNVIKVHLTWIPLK